MLIAMLVTNDCMLELQQRKKEEIKTCDEVVQNYSYLDVCFSVAFNFLEFSVLCEDEV